MTLKKPYIVWSFSFLVCMVCSLELEFTGSLNQWARFLQWDPNLNGNLSFQFRTNMTDSFLLYLDDGGRCDYLKMVVSDSQVQLHVMMHCAVPLKLRAGRKVHNNAWHSVEVSVLFKNVTLTVHGETVHGEVSTVGQYLRVNSNLFVGGIPAEEKARRLHLDKVAPPFKGFVANLKYGNMAVSPINSHQVRSVAPRSCALENPCQNGGICFVNQEGTLCDCYNTGFHGRYCTEDVRFERGFAHLMLGDQGREESMATFKGSEYLCYDLAAHPIQSSSDEITLSFKTLQRNGLILHTGKAADYVNLALKDGAVSLVINLGSGAFEALVEPVTGKFNDNNWHDVKVTRNLRQVNVRVASQESGGQVAKMDGGDRLSSTTENETSSSAIILSLDCFVLFPPPPLKVDRVIESQDASRR